MKNLLIAILNFYQKFLSFDKGALAVFAPGGACRYNPTCSEYTKQKIDEVGAIKGIWLGLKRIWSCR
ncbi:MAG: membrane protein insertion efficiency factor YidD [Candidatus Daviesbacteria bacterium]|nr:membrane protein insertion efficiency factor YidD [Candidatus Daviesbacteria bacterium]